jgi:hypothetical protein
MTHHPASSVKTKDAKNAMKTKNEAKSAGHLPCPRLQIEDCRLRIEDGRRLLTGKPKGRDENPCAASGSNAPVARSDLGKTTRSAFWHGRNEVKAIPPCPRLKIVDGRLRIEDGIRQTARQPKGGMRTPAQHRVRTQWSLVATPEKQRAAHSSMAEGNRSLSAA